MGLCNSLLRRFERLSKLFLSTANDNKSTIWQPDRSRGIKTVLVARLVANMCPARFPIRNKLRPLFIMVRRLKPVQVHSIDYRFR